MFNRLSEYFSDNPQVRQLLLIGVTTHLSTAIIVSIIGYFQFFPAQLSDLGILFGDAVLYLQKCQELSTRIHSGDFSFFFTNDFDVHLRIYTLSYFVFSDVFGNNILCFELINIVLFLTLLFFIYKIGNICFNSKVGFWSALIVNFSPTFLVHSVQPLRDLLYICLFLALIYCLLIIIYRNLRLKEFLKILAVAYLLIFFLWMIRDKAFPVFLTVVLIGFAIFLTGNWKVFKSRLSQFSLVGVFIVLILMIPTLFSSIQPKAFSTSEPSKEKKEKSYNFSQNQIEKGVPPHVRYLNGIRRGINLQIEVEDGSASMDRNLVFESWSDVVFYLPKAILIGLFSPFPNMWFEDGKMFGKTGRIIAAFEVSIIYILSVFALFTVYYQRKHLGLWLIGLTILIGCGALGLVITNIGTLYRMRYAFWFLLIILGINGITQLIEFQRLKKINDQLIT